MKYLLRNNVSGKVPEIEITENEYFEFEKARNILSNALAIEEKYEILISNYLDFERQILETVSGFMIRSHLDYSDFFEIRLGLNIRLVNLLTAARLYIDQLNQNVRDCVPNITVAEEEIKKICNIEYDNNKEYRLMEALRNYVQHRGIPVHLTQLGGRWTSLEGDGSLEYNMDVFSQRSYFEEDPKFKKEILAEQNEKIDLKAATRSYIESISNINETARNMIDKSVLEARKLIEDAQSRYKTICDENLVGLSACIWSDKRQVSAIPLLLDWDNVRVKLQKRNKKLINLKKRYVTSSIKQNNQSK